jgi:hypothetical protein
MSTGTHASPGHDPGNEDGVNMKLIVWVGVVSLAVFAISAVIAWLIMRADYAALEQSHGRANPKPEAMGRDEIGIVDQVEFDNDTRLHEWRLAKEKRLGSYGWVDKTKGLIHIPIDKAMEQVVSQAGAAAPGGTPQQQP